jgi:hypothetical protein
MKMLSVLTHPVCILTSFALVIISGEHFGGFYLVYLLLALPHGGIHAMLALSGAGLIVFSYARYKRQSKYFIAPLLNILGTFNLYISLLVFFYNTWEYNDATFEQTVPVVSLCLFVVLSLAFQLRGIILYSKIEPSDMRAV